LRLRIAFGIPQQDTNPPNSSDCCAGQPALTAEFEHNTLQRVKAGDEAEIAFDAVPGRLFKGKVRQMLDAIAAGHLRETLIRA
jgi:hypothetical protein